MPRATIAKPAATRKNANTGKTTAAKGPVRAATQKARARQAASTERKGKANNRRLGMSSKAVKPSAPAEPSKDLPSVQEKPLAGQDDTSNEEDVDHMDEDRVPVHEAAPRPTTGGKGLLKRPSPNKDSSSSGPSSQGSSDGEDSDKESSSPDLSDEEENENGEKADGEQADGKHSSFKNCGAHNGKGKGDLARATKKYLEYGAKCRDIFNGSGRINRDGTRATLKIHPVSAISACTHMTKVFATADPDATKQPGWFMRTVIGRYNHELNVNKRVDDSINFAPILKLTKNKIKSFNAVFLSFMQNTAGTFSAAYHAAMNDPQFDFVRPPRSTDGKKRRSRKEGVSAKHVTNVANSFENMDAGQREALMQKLADLQRKADSGAASKAASTAMDTE